jgi:hypothetical protein
MYSALHQFGTVSLFRHTSLTSFSDVSLSDVGGKTTAAPKRHRAGFDLARVLHRTAQRS